MPGGVLIVDNLVRSSHRARRSSAPPRARAGRGHRRQALRSRAGVAVQHNQRDLCAVAIAIGRRHGRSRAILDDLEGNRGRLARGAGARLRGQRRPFGPQNRWPCRRQRAQAAHVGPARHDVIDRVGGVDLDGILRRAGRDTVEDPRAARPGFRTAPSDGRPSRRGKLPRQRDRSARAAHRAIASWAAAIAFASALRRRTSPQFGTAL